MNATGAYHELQPISLDFGNHPVASNPITDKEAGKRLGEVLRKVQMLKTRIVGYGMGCETEEHRTLSLSSVEEIKNDLIALIEKADSRFLIGHEAAIGAVTRDLQGLASQTTSAKMKICCNKVAVATCYLSYIGLMFFGFFAITRLA